MNGYQRIMAALQGRKPDRIPVMLHNFMMAAAESRVTMQEFRSNPRAVADSFISSVEKYGFDGVVVDIDTATLAGSVGVPVDYPEDVPARCQKGCIRDLGEVSYLKPPDVARFRTVQVWLEAVRLLRGHFGNEILIRGNCDQCPFSLACMMRSPVAWMLDLTSREHLHQVHQLLEYCTEATSQFIRLMAEAGAHMTSNGDSPAGPDMISPEMYRAFALPYETRIARLAQDLRLPYVLHICGNTDLILEDMLSTGASGFELDQKTDPVRAEAQFRGRATFLGNLDPGGVLAFGTPSLVKQKTLELLRIFAGNNRFVLNSGCAIPANTPPQNIRAMIETARSWTADAENNSQSE